MKSLSMLMDLETEIERQLEASGGELSEELEKFVTEIEVELPQKIDGYSRFFATIESKESYLREKAKKFESAARTWANIEKRLKDSMKAHMIKHKKTELVGNDSVFKLVKTAQKMIISTAALPQEFTKTTVSIEPDREKILAAKELGNIVTGVSFEDNFSLRETVPNAAKRKSK